MTTSVPTQRGILPFWGLKFRKQINGGAIPLVRVPMLPQEGERINIYAIRLPMSLYRGPLTALKPSPPVRLYAAAFAILNR